MLIESNRLKFAIPGKGRLREPAVELLQKAGFKFAPRNRNLYATCTNENITFIFVRPEDIPVLAAQGVIDLGITGSDLVIERGCDVVTVLNLDFGKCRLCVAVREEIEEHELSFLSGKRIATSFPEITQAFFREKGIEVSTIEMNGSVEIMVALGLADAIVDIVETGDSLRDNNLKVFTDIGRYETVLVANKSVAQKSEVEKIRRRIEGIIVATQYTLLEYNVHRDNLKQAEIITPGFSSPTLSPLEAEGWYAVKVMVRKNTVPEVMDKLEAIGARAILETEVKNCRL